MSRRLEVYSPKSTKLIQYCSKFDSNTVIGLPCIIRGTLYWISSYINESYEFVLYIENTGNIRNAHHDKIIGIIVIEIDGDNGSGSICFKLFDFEKCVASEIFKLIDSYIKLRTRSGKKINSIKISRDNYYSGLLVLKYKSKVVEDNLILFTQM